MTDLIRKRPIRRQVRQVTLCWLLLFGLQGAAGPLRSALAQPRPSVPPAATAAQPASGAADSRGSALAEIASAIALAFGAIADGALVVAGPIRSDGPLERPAELATRLAAVVAGAVDRHARSERPAASLTRARALAASVDQLIFVAAEIVQGELRVTADLYRGKSRFWERVRETTPASQAHTFVSRRLDAELRTFLPPIPLVARRIERFKTGERDWVALACGDTDHDGSLELVLVSRRRVVIGRIRKGQLVVLATRLWSELGPVAPSPLREPIAGITIESGRFIDVGLSDRADALRFDAELGVLEKLGRRMPWGIGGCSTLLGVGLEGRILPCATSDPAEARPNFGQASDALAAARVVQADGKSRLYYAARAANTAVLALRDDTGRSARIDGAGAQLALADLDLDGQPEVLSASDTLDPRTDALIVRTWLGTGAIAERWRVPVPGGVRAVAACPPESNGLAASVIATADELWVVR